MTIYHKGFRIFRCIKILDYFNLYHLLLPHARQYQIIGVTKITMIRTKDSQIEIDSKSLRSRLPDAPGVYLFKDRSGKVIYVGKAKNLKKRVLSYFKDSFESHSKTALMMQSAKNLNFIITDTENEAFILESSLIKRHMPRYNIILRDDKQYPCLRLGIKDTYPRLSIVRKIKKDGALYFGPFSSSHSVRSTLKLIDKIFTLRKCKSNGLPKRARPCLNYQLGRCLAPCTRKIPTASYSEIVDQVRLFLEGRNRELLKKLEKEMKRFASQENFEDAAGIRDQIRAVQKTIERQNVVSAGMEDQDVIGLAQEGETYQLAILFVRKGYLTGSRDFLFRNRGALPLEIMESFLKQYYHNMRFIPKNILISEPVDDLDPITNWLSDLAGKKISIHYPIRGKKLRLVKMAVSNASNLLAGSRGPSERDLMEMAKSVLKLKRTPNRIEGLDISNLLGSNAVGTIVVFRDGLPDKSGYRNYRIRDVEAIDDYGMISELAFRRLSRGNAPDLFLVDGGKGHLSAVRRVVDNFYDEGGPEVVAIAKGEDRGNGDTDKLYLPGRKNPLLLRPEHPVLLLLMRVRDEAHRRAITYHRRLRDKDLKKSRLDLIPGIGPKKKRLLLKRFGNIEAILRLKPKDISLVPGISYSLAQEILDFLLKKPLEKGDVLIEDKG